MINNDPEHDTITRWINTVKLKPHILWEYAQGLVQKDKGYLIVDDTVIDKFFGPNIELVGRHYSGRHHKPVQGIDVTNLIWNGLSKPDKAEHIPIDFRVYDIEHDTKTKNDHCHDMLDLAYQRGFRNITVLMDSAFSDGATLRRIRKYNWKFVAGLKSNRIISFNSHEYHLEDYAIEQAKECYLKDFGNIKVIKYIRKGHRDFDYIATNNLQLSSSAIRLANDRRWKVEEYHRGEKQTTGIKNCQFRNARAQRNHILCSNLAFLTIEKYRLETGCSWYESKHLVIVNALKEYLKRPFMPLPLNGSI